MLSVVLSLETNIEEYIFIMLICTSRCIGNQFQVYGELSVSLQLASNKCEYKYAFLNDKEYLPRYEEIIEYQKGWGDGRGYVHRYLDIETKNLPANSKLTITGLCELLHMKKYLTLCLKTVRWPTSITAIYFEITLHKI